MVNSNFIELIKSVILNKTININNLNIEEIIRYAKFHSLEYIIYLSLKKINIDENTEIFKMFEKTAKVNAYKSVVQDIEYDIIINAFEKASIKHLPLKGSIIRKMYPNIQWRSMADLDILIPVDDLKKAGDVLKELGYNADHLGGNHDSYVKKPYMNIELHRAMIDEAYNVNNYYDNIWNIVKREESSEYLYKLSDEDFFIFLIAHAAKHFSGGGTGIRTIIDIYVYLENKELDFQYIYQELEKMELVKFCKLFIAISNYIFKDQINEFSVEDLELIIDYVEKCGTYGTIANSGAQEMDNEDIEKGKKKVILKRLFPPFSIMKRRNPILKKIPILLPWFWFTRLIKGLLHSKTHKKTYNAINQIDVEKYKQVKRIKDISGVKL